MEKKEEKKVEGRTYSCYFMFEGEDPVLIAENTPNGIALELSPLPQPFQIDKKTRVKHVGAMEFVSKAGKKFTIFLKEDENGKE